MALRFPPVSQFLERFRALLTRRRLFDFDTEVDGLSRVEQAVALLALLELRKSGEIALEPGAAVRSDKGFASRRRKDPRMESPLRLIAANPVDRLARTVEALLVVASAPLSVDELCDATEDHPERIETAIGLLRERYSEGRSGIVLEEVAGGFAFRASRDAADACARLFERPVERGLSQAALETLAIVAYLGPCSRPDVARIRGVAADSAVASLVERGLIAEAGRESGTGRCGPLPDDAALRARLRAREPRRAAAPRRPRRGRRGAPRAPARGRRSPSVVAQPVRRRDPSASERCCATGRSD